MPTTRSKSSQRTRETVAQSNEPPQKSAADAGREDYSVIIRKEYNTQSRIRNAQQSKTKPRNGEPDEPPKFTIDLSLPPEQRYLEVCAALKSEIVGLTSLFDEVVGPMASIIPIKWLHFICGILLRGVYKKEETAELRGISRATGVSMYLLVCFNVLLDLFMGCSSGGAAIGTDTEKQRTKMVHFRTLDWGMPALRRIVVHLDFVMKPGGPVVASSITYAGFVGVLTGVRKDFSVSLNFRPNHNDSDKFWANTFYGWHLLMVLLGYRQSISSVLRECLFPKQCKAGSSSWIAASYEDVIAKFGKQPSHKASKSSGLSASTACYLCFSNGTETTVVEKDRVSAKVRSDKDFIVITNSDDQPATEINSSKAKAPSQHEPPFDDTLAEIVNEAIDRKQCAEHNWHNMKVARAKELRVTTSKHVSKSMSIDDVITMVQKYPTTNETTHFACVMDPKEGNVAWCRRWIKPVTAKWIREHQSSTW